MKLTVAHQRRDQLSKLLQGSVMSAHTTVCFRLNPEDGREMAHVFPDSEPRILPEDIAEHPSKELLNRTPEVEAIEAFVELYLRSMQGHKRGTSGVNIDVRGYAPDFWDIAYLITGAGGQRPDFIRVDDPTPYLDNLLHQVMVTGDASLDIPPEIVRGFSNCGGGFFKAARKLHHGSKQLTSALVYPTGLIVQSDGVHVPARTPEGQTERMFYFICVLRLVMRYLAENPMGKATSSSTTDVAKLLSQLPPRWAFIRSGDAVGTIKTHDVPAPLPAALLKARAEAILIQTRQRYCHPKAEVEKLFMQTVAAADKPQFMPPTRPWNVIE